MVESRRSFAMLKWNQRHQCAVLGFYRTHVCELVGCPDQIAENCSTTVMSTANIQTLVSKCLSNHGSLDIVDFRTQAEKEQESLEQTAAHIHTHITQMMDSSQLDSELA